MLLLLSTMSPKSSLCVACKGVKMLCGLEECPILNRTRSIFNTFLNVTKKNEVIGPTPPSSIVGEKGYPVVSVIYNIAPKSEEKDPSFYDDPKAWHNKVDLKEIVKLRSSLLGGLMRVPATDPWRLYEGEVSLALLSLKPVDSEALLKRPPVLQLSFDSLTRPLGLISPLKKLRITDSPKIDRDLEKLIWDDVLAKQAIIELYSKGKDVYLIEKALSLGLIGIRKNRKLVPTRWAITAVDDTISEYLRKEILKFDAISEIRIYTGEYLHNKFLIVLLPGTYEGYWLEVWYPKSIWVQSSLEPAIAVAREKPNGEIIPQDGGFSAARLAVLEYLYKNRRKAKYIILREVMPEYLVPVGNWHIRETVRVALSSKPFIARDYKEAYSFIEENLQSKIAYRAFQNLMKEAISQKSLDEYISIKEKGS